MSQSRQFRRERKSPFAVQQTQSAVHPHAQRNAFRSRARQQSRSFAPRNQSLRPSLCLDRSHSSPPLRFNLFGKVANLLVTNGSNTRY
jgi:hypothetical protein